MTELEDAKDWLRMHLDEGARCPCCMQYAKVYRRKIHAAMARDLCRAYRTAGGGRLFHVRTVLGHDGGDFAKLAYWGLIEELDATRDDGSNRAGMWRITPLGVDYIRNRIRLPKYARVYDGRCLGLDDSEVAGIIDALGTRFDYSALMAGE